jgi:IS5 family transposase
LYEFGCEVSIATPVAAPKGGQFVLHAKALHGSLDGHTLSTVMADLEKLTGVTVRRIHDDKGYRGHNYTNRFKVWISGQVRRVTRAIRREMSRRAVVEPVIGHLKQDHRMRRNYLTGRDGDRINVARGCRLQLPVCSCAVRRAFTRLRVDPLPRPLGRPTS